MTLGEYCNKYPDNPISLYDEYGKPIILLDQQGCRIRILVAGELFKYIVPDLLACQVTASQMGKEGDVETFLNISECGQITSDNGIWYVNCKIGD